MEFCPYCDAKINNMYDIFSSHDYSTSFEFECSACKKTIEVSVEAVPEFTLCAIKEAQTTANNSAKAGSEASPK